MWNNDNRATNASVATFGGVGKYKGKWSMMCKSCGWNTTHTTGFHQSYIENPSSFTLPATHVFWAKSGMTPPKSMTLALTAKPVATTTNLLSSRVRPLLTQYKTGTDDSQFSSFLANFEGVLN